MPVSVLVNERGHPEPPSDVLKRLAAWGVSIRWSGFNQWAVVRPWEPQDRRWKWVHENKMDRSGAEDVLGYVPQSCPTDQVPSFVENVIKDWPHEHRERTLARVRETNKAPEEQVAVVEEAIAETIEVASEQAFGVKTKGRRRKVDLKPKGED